VPFSAKILADSVSPHGFRLTTFELTFPRVILAEFNTHRMISRNAASSRAIPTEKLIQRVVDDPFIPEFRANQKGMQAGDALDKDDSATATRAWLNARDEAVARAKQMHGWNIHKQYINRLLEPWMWCTVIASATDWANLFHLRCSPEAEPSFNRVATMARELYESSEPAQLGLAEYHLPLIFEEDRRELGLHDLVKVSVGRCARVSYLTHDGKRDHAADIELHDRLAKSGHWSPFEHQASAMNCSAYIGNFKGWHQYRKLFDSENVESYAQAVLSASSPGTVVVETEAPPTTSHQTENPSPVSSTKTEGEE
jgi:thymidylate synthase ThyX